MFVQFAYRLTSYDPDRPWIVIGMQHLAIELDDAKDFAAWAAERWPKPRYGVELAPGQAPPIFPKRDSG